MAISYRDNNSPNEIRFPNPRKRTDVIKHGQIYVAQEQTRPVEQQTPFTPIISDLLQRTIAAENELKQAERERKSAASELKSLLGAARKIIWNMWKSVTAKCSDKPHQATNWGFYYKANTGNVILPKSLEERLETLNAYISQEQSQPEDQRFPIPDLLDVIDMHMALEDQADTRAASLRKRESQVERCNELALKLCNYLQAAGIYLLAMEFKFKISKDLQNWGYDIAAKSSSSSSREESGGETTPTPEPATNGSSEPVVKDSTLLNGTADVDVEVVDADSEKE
ncbi:MAG: hypothetical protein KDJ65_32765 [Anaerolineae bacterium]|nr:hypothetical protein [Anaerolineae bacterium]